MSEHLLCMIESLENAAERWADENMVGDRFLCPGCQKWSNLGDALATSPNPYALPICYDCVKESQ